MSAAPDTATCRRCGMPLAYDARVSDAAVLARRSDPALCSYCGDAENDGRHVTPVEERDASWVLDLMIAAYLGRRPGVRSAARVLSRLRRTLPESLAAVADVVASVPSRSRTSNYDAVVLYSGGKDSTYMLLDLAQRRKLKVCAWMLQQGYQSPAAIANAKHICSRIGVPLVIAEPERVEMDSLFRLGFGIDGGGQSPEDVVRSVMTYGSACWPCFATIAAQATKFCRENDAAFCFIGTQKGQNRLDLHGRPVLAGQGLPRVDFLVSKFMSRFRDFAGERRPTALPLLESGDCRAVLVPFYELVAKPPVEEQLRSISAAGWKMPNNTGACSTNCMINELGRHVMRKRYGFDLYQVIDAHERRLRPDPGAAPVVAPLDDKAVARGAKLIKLDDAERREYGLEERDGAAP
jgi:hypothetical protein